MTYVRKRIVSLTFFSMKINIVDFTIHYWYWIILNWSNCWFLELNLFGHILCDIVQNDLWTGPSDALMWTLILDLKNTMSFIDLGKIAYYDNTCIWTYCIPWIWNQMVSVEIHYFHINFRFPYSIWNTIRQQVFHFIKVNK